MSAASLVLSSFTEVMNIKADQLPKALEYTMLPHFQNGTIMQLIKEFNAVSITEPTLLRLSGNMVVVGDLHGNIVDLLRILEKHNAPPKTMYLFLGDYVDRGEFSLEVITLLYSLKVLYPKFIYMIRGNHEELNVNKAYGFYDSIMNIYNDDSLWKSFNDSFAYLSLAAIIDDRFFCVHGGLSPALTNLRCIESIQKPILETTRLIDDLLWSDPTDLFSMFGENERGKGSKFGPAACSVFLHNTGLTTIIRAHECVKNGVELRRPVITVFSSSNYSPEGNVCGILIYGEQILKGTLPKCQIMHRSDASFVDIIEPQIKTSNSDDSKILAKSLLMNFQAFKVVPIAGFSSGRCARPKSKTPVLKTLPTKPFNPYAVKNPLSNTYQLDNANPFDIENSQLTEHRIPRQQSSLMIAHPIQRIPRQQSSPLIPSQASQIRQTNIPKIMMPDDC